jgi:centrin-1
MRGGYCAQLAEMSDDEGAGGGAGAAGGGGGGNDDDGVPYAPLPWGVPTNYVCVRQCKVHAGADNTEAVAFLNEGEAVTVLEHVEMEPDDTVRIRFEYKPGATGWVSVQASDGEEQLQPVERSVADAAAAAAASSSGGRRIGIASAPKYEGFLSKLSPKASRLSGIGGTSKAGAGWQKRWFVLDGPAGTLSYYREKDARSMFEEMDADGSGYLDMQEVEQLCKQLGKKLSKKEMQLAMGEMDRDGNGEVSFPEFEAWWTVHCAKQAGKRAAAGTIELKDVHTVHAVVRRCIWAGTSICHPSLLLSAVAHASAARPPRTAPQPMAACLLLWSHGRQSQLS